MDRQATSSHFKRELGLFDATMVVAGAIIGVGIFVNPSNVARLLEAPAWMLAVWVVGGIIATLGGFVYAELGSRLPLVGGQYIYLARAWHPFVGYLYGFSLLFVINSGGIAAVATALSSYVDRSFLPLGATGRTLLSAGVVVLLAEVNVRGVGPGKRLNNALMMLKLAGIAGIFGLAIFGSTGAGAAASSGPVAPVPAPSLSLFFAALVPVLFAYGGWQNCGSLAAEIREPGRTLARANVAGVALVVAVYVGLNVVYLSVLSPAEIASSGALAADVAGRLAGPVGARFVAALIVISCLGFLAVMTLTGPRLYFAMAKDGVFWRRAGELHPRYSTPAFTIRMQAALALVLLLTQSYDQLLSYVVFADWLFFALAAAGLFVLRRRGTDPSGLFRAPGHPWSTGLFVAVAAGVVINSFVAAPVQALAGCGVLALGSLVYFVSRPRARH